ncbi:MAG: hypothetical protein AB1599_04595 [Planctomycetota bacterium]
MMRVNPDVKYFCLVFILAAVTFGHLSIAYSQTIISEESSVFSGSGYKISVSEWITQGDFRMHGGPSGADNTWELTHPVDGGMTQLLLAYTEEKNSPYIVNISLSAGNVRQDTIRDTDWDEYGVITDLSYSTVKGNTYGFSFSTDYRVTDLREPYEFYITFGYNRLALSSDYQDAHIVIADGAPVDIYAWQDRKWQIYDLVYQGLEIGVKGKSEVSKGLLLSGSLGYMPFVYAEYKGTRYKGTILEADEHIVAYGTALTYELALRYNMSGRFFVDGGYRYSAYRTEGEDQPGSAWAGAWEELDTDFKGFFFGCGLKF